jgi:hypothetical protein
MTSRFQSGDVVNLKLVGTELKTVNADLAYPEVDPVDDLIRVKPDIVKTATLSAMPFPPDFPIPGKIL